LYKFFDIFKLIHGLRQELLFLTILYGISIIHTVAKHIKREKEELSWIVNRAMMVKNKVSICIKEKMISIENFIPLIKQT
jgi:hypothetical protein